MIKKTTSKEIGWELIECKTIKNPIDPCSD